MGKMHGIFLMEREIDGKLFNVKVPEFLMIVPFNLSIRSPNSVIRSRTVSFHMFVNFI